jgi:hypothetical protein
LKLEKKEVNGMERRSLLPLMVVWFIFASCAYQQQDLKQARDTDAIKTIQTYKQKTLDELGTFRFNDRKYIHETLDELANQLRASRKYTVLIRKETKTFEAFPILELIDRDGDGKADSFAYTPKDGGDTQEFGFIFDLNKDGKIDYIVFNQGLAMTKDMKFYWSKYHWIDSNYDGKIDIYVNPTIDLDGDKSPDEGVTAWVYDTDFDGDVDKAEYLGKNFQKSIEKTEGGFIIKAWTGEFKVGKDFFSFRNKVLSDINSLLQQMNK